MALIIEMIVKKTNKTSNYSFLLCEYIISFYLLFVYYLFTSPSIFFIVFLVLIVIYLLILVLAVLLHQLVF